MGARTCEHQPEQRVVGSASPAKRSPGAVAHRYLLNCVPDHYRCLLVRPEMEGKPDGHCLLCPAVHGGLELRRSERVSHSTLARSAATTQCYSYQSPWTSPLQSPTHKASLTRRGSPLRLRQLRCSHAHPLRLCGKPQHRPASHAPPPLRPSSDCPSNLQLRRKPEQAAVIQQQHVSPRPPDSRVTARVASRRRASLRSVAHRHHPLMSRLAFLSTRPSIISLRYRNSHRKLSNALAFCRFCARNTALRAIVTTRTCCSNRS